MSLAGRLPNILCLGVIQLSPCHTLDTVGSLFSPPHAPFHQPVPLGWPPWQKGDKRMCLWRVSPPRSEPEDSLGPWEPMA